MAGKETIKGAVENVEAVPKKRKAEENGPQGMAWGARSFAAARISSIREKDPASISDFGRYMAEKRRKLHVQYNEDSSNKLLSGATAAVAAQHSKEGQIVVAENSAKLQLFKGISIWVDGFTIPSHQELRHLMLQYGGVFENYFRRELVTHIICSTLPDSKIKDPRSLSRGLPIVRPEWVVDSIAASRVLPWAPYQLQRIALEHPNQRTLRSAYSAPRLDNGPLPLDWRDGSPVHTEAIHDGKISTQELLALEYGPSSPRSVETSGRMEKYALQDADLGKRYGGDRENDEDELMDRTGVSDFPSVEEMEKGDEENAAECLEITIKAELGKHGEEVDAGVVGKVNRKISSGYPDAARTHSTLGDRNFVQNYYKYSRLHFIGTWRNRYQSRYGSLGKHEKPDEQEHGGMHASSGGPPAIIHIDMDCFFVAVVVRERRELDGKPVAVCHSDSARGTGEISSANYPARAFGIRAGMFVRDAKARCPDLEIVPYNFEAYEQVADQVYDILHHHCGRVQAVSCDEAFLNVTGQGDPNEIATTIRRQIFDATQCTASAGIAGNMLLARLATRKAKPNGQYHIIPQKVEGFLAELAVEDLPGVGWTLKDKLHSHNLRKCIDILSVSKDFLQREFGTKTGDMLWSYARGIDIREVQPAQERKSIGAEVNWGVRFLVPEDAQRFLVTLSTEVATRLQTAAAKGRTITLKVKRRKEGAGEPSKFMGCGDCDNFSRSETVAYATDSQEVLLRVARQLFNSFHLDVCEVRGVGLQVTKLEPVGPGQPLKGGQGQQRALESWLAPQTNKAVPNEEILQVSKSDTLHTNLDSNKPLTGLAQPALVSKSGIEAPNLQPRVFQQDDGPSHSEPSPSELQPQPQALTSPNFKETRKHAGLGGKPPVRTIKKLKKPGHAPPTGLPPISDLDPSVLASLPPDILAEIQEVYGELPAHPVPGPSKAKSEQSSSPASLAKRGQIRQSPKRGIKLETPVEKGRFRSAGRALGFETRSEHGESSRLPSDNSEITALPSASQVDPSVMAALPLSLRWELEQEYKRQQSERPGRPPVPKFVKEEEPEAASTSERGPQVRQDTQKPAPLNELWLGSPPNWIRVFKEHKVADFNTLCSLAEQMSSQLPLKAFSAVLRSLLPHLSQSSSAPVDETVIQSCVELLKQYAQLKVARDLEEVWMVMRVLRGVAAKSQLWRVVEDLTVPSIQAIVEECYGGHLKF